MYKFWPHNFQKCFTFEHISLILWNTSPWFIWRASLITVDFHNDGRLSWRRLSWSDIMTAKKTFWKEFLLRCLLQQSLSHPSFTHFSFQMLFGEESRFDFWKRKKSSDLKWHYKLKVIKIQISHLKRPNLLRWFW